MGAYYLESMQTIVVKNNTNEPIYNIKLTHNGERSNDYIINKLKVNTSERASIYTLKVKGNCELIVEYEYNKIRKSKVVYDKLNKNDRRYIILTFSDGNGELKIDMDFQSIYE